MMKMNIIQKHRLKNWLIKIKKKTRIWARWMSSVFWIRLKNRQNWPMMTCVTTIVWLTMIFNTKQIKNLLITFVTIKGTQSGSSMKKMNTEKMLLRQKGEKEQHLILIKNALTNLSKKINHQNISDLKKWLKKPKMWNL